MQSTAVRALKTLTSKIHQPLPLNPRESQQLLEKLTTSFQQHLDKEHPFSPPQDDVPPLLSRGAQGAPPDCPPRISSQSSASDHLQAILTNPLFSKSHKPSVRLPPASRANTSKDMGEWLDHHIAMGTADIPKALLFIYRSNSHALTKINEIAQSGEGGQMRKATMGQVLSELAMSGPGLKVVNWLRSSGHQLSDEFLAERTFISQLSKLLFLEGRQDVLYQWISRRPPRPQDIAAAAQKELNASFAKWQGSILRAMVTAAVLRNQEDADDALRVLLRASAIRDEKGYILSARAFCFGADALLHMTFFRTESRHTFLRRDCKWSMSPALLDQLLAQARLWSRSGKLQEALLRLYHPSRPSAEAGLAYLKAAAVLNAQALLGFNRDLSMRLLLGVPKLLMEHGRHEDAAWALEFAQANIPAVLSRRRAKTKPVEKPGAQEESIDILDELSFA